MCLWHWRHRVLSSSHLCICIGLLKVSFACHIKGYLLPSCQWCPSFANVSLPSITSIQITSPRWWLVAARLWKENMGHSGGKFCDYKLFSFLQRKASIAAVALEPTSLLLSNSFFRRRKAKRATLSLKIEEQLKSSSSWLQNVHIFLENNHYYDVINVNNTL